MSEQLVTPENVTTKDGKINLLDLNRQQMREFFKDLGEKPFRADQVMKWMYHYCCDNFDEMTDINKVLRGKLKEVAEIRAPEVVEEQRSSDGTMKRYISRKTTVPRSASLRRWGVRWSVNSVPPPSRALTATCGYRKLSARCGVRRKLSAQQKSPVSAQSLT